MARKRFQRDSSTIALGTLLRDSIYLNSSDPHDKVYALLGLAHEHDKEAIQIDYDKQPSKVFTETMRYIISSERKLDSLSFARATHGSPSRRSVSIPSWVSDWSIQSIRLRPLWEPGLYDASNQNPTMITPSKDFNTLCIEGLRLDSIAHITEQIKFEESWNKNQGMSVRREIRKLEEWILDVVEKRSLDVDREAEPDVWKRIMAMSPDSGESDVLWRTLIADRVRTKNHGYVAPAPSICATLYKLFMNGLPNYDIHNPETDLPRLMQKISEEAEVEAPRMWNPMSVPGVKEEELHMFANLLMKDMSVMDWRRLFVTKTGYLGLTRASVKLATW